ncbi:MAG: AraC family transcriptional regulator [Firmicutes bacterium]|nr:AraC family transcriptional regulator [Bacillota bacterium]
MNESELDIQKKSRWISAALSDNAVRSGFYFTEAGEFFADENYYARRDGRDDFLLLYTQSGEGTVKTRDRQFALKKAHAVIIDCSEYHEYSSNGSWDFYWAHIKGGGVKAMAGSVLNREIAPYDDEEFQNLLEKILNIGADIKRQYETGLAIHTILCRLNAHNGAETESDAAEKMNAAVKFIEENCAAQITVDDMAEAAHMSKYHFIRRFKKYAGVTPYRYLINCRVNISKAMLRQTDRSVSEIAEKCGFLDDSNYIYRFKKYVGQTPSQYRRDFI